jgi:hypothetical protein
LTTFDGLGGLDVGLGVGRGVGRAVGPGVAVALAVGAGVGRGVGAGLAVGRGAEVGVAAGRGVDPGAALGGADATAVAGDGLAVATGGVGTTDGETCGTGSLAVGSLAVGSPDAPGPVPGVDVAVEGGVGVVTTAIGGRSDAADRPPNPTPPIPSAIVARTRFRTPRLKMSRAR